MSFKRESALIMRLLFLLFAVLVMLVRIARAEEDVPNPNLVPPAPMHEQVLHLPGDPDRPVDLIVTLYTPEGPGPFPLVVMNHGSSGDGIQRATMQRYRFTMSAYYFLSRGYAVALPMMRGFGGSGGTLGRYGCALDRLAMDNGRDIEAVIADLAVNPHLDMTRVIVAGQSFGGWNTLGLGALQPRNVRGLIDFVGGVQYSPCSDIGDNTRSLITAAGRLGSFTRLPSIWFYGENDSLFGSDIWRPMHQAYTLNGGEAELVDVGRFMEDSHQMLSRPEAIPLWAPRLDSFLVRIGMPGREVLPQYMPRPWPQPTHFAAVDDVAAVPWIGTPGQNSYRKFLAMHMPRVFMISPAGQSVSTQGGFDPLVRAADTCRTAGFSCLPYAIDGDVVFIAPTSAHRPPATHFAAIDDVAAVPWLNEKGRAAYRNFLSHPPPRAFVLGMAGENIATFNGSTDPLARAMMICTNMRLACRPYAVDLDVVWAPPPELRPLHATSFAAIDNVGAVPWASAGSRKLYERFLTMPFPRAFVIAQGGQASLAQGGYDPVGRSLKKCRDAGLICRPYAFDNSVVWSQTGGN